nr:hypothetical protein [uncultured Vibrio sp.]
MNITIPFIYLAQNKNAIIAVKDTLNAHINIIDPKQFPIALTAKLTNYHWHDGQLWTADWYRSEDNLDIAQLSEIKDRTENQDRELQTLPSPGFLFDNFWIAENRRFISKRSSSQSHKLKPKTLSQVPTIDEIQSVRLHDDNRQAVIKTAERIIASRCSVNEIMHRKAAEPRYVIINNAEETSVNIQNYQPTHSQEANYFNANQINKVKEVSEGISSNPTNWPDGEITVSMPEAVKAPYNNLKIR